MVPRLGDLSGAQWYYVCVCGGGAIDLAERRCPERRSLSSRRGRETVALPVAKVVGGAGRAGRSPGSSSPV